MMMSNDRNICLYEKVRYFQNFVNHIFLSLLIIINFYANTHTNTHSSYSLQESIRIRVRVVVGEIVLVLIMADTVEEEEVEGLVGK